MNTIPDRDLVLATAEAISLWSDPRYADHLSRRHSFTRKWFDEFLAIWGVARTVIGDRRADVLAYFNSDFQRAVARNNDGTVVTAAAAAIADSGWTPEGRRPISLASKIAFFFRPERFIPMDRWSRDGVRRLLDSNQAPPINATYGQYLAAFDSLYEMHSETIERAAAARWAKDLARRAGCAEGVLTAEAFRRKVLDNALMRVGGRPF